MVITVGSLELYYCAIDSRVLCYSYLRQPGTTYMYNLPLTLNCIFHPQTRPILYFHPQKVYSRTGKAYTVFSIHRQVLYYTCHPQTGLILYFRFTYRSYTVFVIHKQVPYCTCNPHMGPTCIHSIYSSTDRSYTVFSIHRHVLYCLSIHKRYIPVLVRHTSPA